MKRLLILRHASSSWEGPHGSDLDRPLNARGEKEARAVGAAIAAKGIAALHVAASPANRALTTARLVLEAAGLDVTVATDERIYEAHPETLLRIIAELPKDAPCVLLVGHNPGIEGLVRYLTGKVVAISPATLVDLEVSGEWTDLAPANCHLTDLAGAGPIDQ